MSQAGLLFFYTIFAVDWPIQQPIVEADFPKQCFLPPNILCKKIVNPYLTKRPLSRVEQPTAGL